MNRKPVEPLSAEERELAALLGRAGPHGEPSPALDAKILAAAHSAVARDDARVPQRRRRWPAIAGLAASVLFAAGIAWQLRPQHEAMQASEAPAAAAVVASDAAAPEMADAAAPAADMPGTDAAPAASEPLPPSVKQLAPPPPLSKPALERKREMPPTEVAEARPTDIAPTPTAPLPPPPPAPAPIAMEPAPRAFAPAMAPAPTTARQQAHATEAAAAPAADTGADTKAVANDDATLDSIVVSGSALVLADIPVGEDAKLSKTDWLQRIRARKAEGGEDDARESLRLFVRKYPRTTIPSGLRDLLKE